jgi:hypothetical protein
MPFLLRKVKLSRWVRSACPWLGYGEIPADVLMDLGTQNNELSLWEVDDDRANLNRIISAMAATKENFDPFDFMLIDRRRVEDTGLALESSPGDTPDEGAQAWHYGVSLLTTQKVNLLAAAYWEHGLDADRVYEPDVTSWVIQGVRESRLNPAAMKPKLRGKVEKMLAK